MTEERPRPPFDVSRPSYPPDNQAVRSPEPLPILSVQNVIKDYPGVRALEGVTLDLRPGEVHALVGENGAGKSTLIRIMCGDMRPDSGAIYLQGVETRFRAPSDARQSGIATICQEFMIVPDMNVAENIVLGEEPGLGPDRQCYSWRQAERIADEVLRRLGERSTISTRTIAGQLSTGQKQIVEIARALVQHAPVIILDEPTAALSDKETKVLLDILRQLRSEGAAILFVSHRLEEVRSIADRITVLRGGRHIATLHSNDVSHAGQLIELMVGRGLADLFPVRNEAIRDIVFSVRGFSRQGAFENVSFDVRAGEVLGFAGLIGAGRTEVMRAVFGADPHDEGTVTKGGRRLNIRAPSDAIEAGIAYLPEDRKDDGLVLLLSGYENLVMASLASHSKFGVVSWPGIRKAASAVANRLQFRGRLDEPARTISGGNQQKLVLGKWILTQADVFIFDEPTRGIDVGAKAEVYRLIHALAARGAAIIVVSSESGELINLCHRILVMSGGRVCDEMKMEEFDEHRILTSAFTAHIGERTSAQKGLPASGATKH